jgi:glycosyltransferase involved in cell wall biosynthesis
VGERRVSVVIPAYNAERYVGQAIHSVLAQTCPPHEIVVVDDGSTDDTAAVVCRFGEPVRYLRQPHRERGGAAQARNLGVDAAHGDLLAFLDADDLWVPDKLQHQIDALDATPTPDLVFVMARELVSPELGPVQRARLECRPAPTPAYLAGSMLLARRTFLRVGPFNPTWEVGEMLDWYLRATELGLTEVVVPEALLLRRLHRENLGVRSRDARPDYARILKASLDRRRASAQPGAEPTSP